MIYDKGENKTIWQDDKKEKTLMVNTIPEQSKYWTTQIPIKIEILVLTYWWIIDGLNLKGFTNYHWFVVFSYMS
jgi:hypothetical protein